ncbi:MAG TPA: hypothetical protein VFH99_02135 [Candidatus Saccharimonadales bacterium]|nr:hypothetical protein [Candidatus Saccharimonadales bacterium]
MSLRRRDPNRPRTDMEVMEDFRKAKDLPAVSRVVGGTRRVYYEHPDRVRVIHGRNLPFQAVGRLAAEAERRGVSKDELAEELELIQEPEDRSLPARIGERVIQAIGLR